MPEWKYLPQRRENKREGFVQVPTHRITVDTTLRMIHKGEVPQRVPSFLSFLPEEEGTLRLDLSLSLPGLLNPRIAIRDRQVQHRRCPGQARARDSAPRSRSAYPVPCFLFRLRTAHMVPPPLVSFQRHPWMLVVVGLLAALLLVGCGSDEDAPVAPPPPSHHTLVFLDWSASADAHPEARQLFADSLARIVRMHLRRPGDRLKAFLLHEKTRSKAYRLDLRNDVRPREEKDFPDEQALENARYKKAVAEYLDTATTQLQQFGRSADVPTAYARWTDVWGTLEVASEELPTGRAERHVYYLSDMYESMPGPDRRNFDRRPPPSRADANAWARTDAERLPDLLTLRPAVLQTATVRVLQGTLATKAHAQDVKVYWQTLFAELGVPPEQVQYN